MDYPKFYLAYACINFKLHFYFPIFTSNLQKYYAKYSIWYGYIMYN